MPTHRHRRNDPRRPRRCRRHDHRPGGWVLSLLVAATLLVVAPTAASAASEQPAVRYRPPVAGPIVDPYRRPLGPYAPGNRGLDLAATPGQPVGAAADGEVTFAGQVGGTRHVVVLHADGLRSSTSFLATVEVARGDLVTAGQRVGTAGPVVHVGLRRGEDYLDPAPYLYGHGRVQVRLVATDQRPLSAEEEAIGLRGLLSASGRLARMAELAADLVTATVDPAVLEALLAVVATSAGGPALAAARVVAEVAAAERRSGPCTPTDVAAPVAPAARARRLLVLVGGLGSETGAASVLDVDARDLGYAPGDVVQAGYRGGTAETVPYGADDTAHGIDAPAAALADLLRRLAATHPGVPIDVVAHSMGGLVARAALAHHRSPPEPPVRRLITLATPHGGADLARLAVAARALPPLALGERAADALALPVDPGRQSVADLAPGSAFLQRLDVATPPAGLVVTSIAARTDVVVPSIRARPAWPGARTAVVDLPLTSGLHAHAALPGSAAAAREIALALDDRPPTCRSHADVVVDAAIGVAAATAAL